MFFCKIFFRFFPKLHTIVVASEQTQIISFSQLKATIEGQLKCFKREDCEDITISIKPVEQPSEKNTIILGHFGNYKSIHFYSDFIMASNGE